MVTSTNRGSAGRGLGAMLRYRAWTAFVVFAVVVSVALWGLGQTRRVYRIESGLTFRAGTQPEILQPARDQALASLRSSLADAAITATDSRITASIKTDNPNQGYVALSNALEAATRAGNQVAIASVSNQREALSARVAEITTLFNAAQSRVDKLEQAHPDLADNNAGPTVRLERISTRQEERFARRKVVEEQIQRTESYAKKMRELGFASAAAPARTADAAPSAADRDPEVMQLAAQMQLIDDQLEEQLTRLRRTEQHPYVVDLRSRQAALQQKLRGARERATAGQPPPAAAVAAVGGTGNTNMAVQAAEFQLQQLVAERDQLGAELSQLKEQENALRSQIELLRPTREQWRQAKEKIATLKQDREAAEARLRTFDESARATGGLPISADGIGSGYKTPIWPRLDIMLLGACAAGCITAILAVFVREKMDHTYQTPERFAALTGAPILGVVDEIYSPRQWRYQRLWRWIGRPVIVLALLAFPVLSAMALMK